MRPTDTGPAHARHGGAAAFRPTDTDAAWPVYRSEVLTRRPGWPVDEPEFTPPAVPFARAAESGPGHEPPRRAAAVAWPGEQDAAPIPAPLKAKKEPPKRKAVSADMYFDTVPMGRIRRPEAVVHVLPETPATGLRKFDLGNVPASVTPPRSWRRAAWFAVGTSAAVVLGLAFASAELMGRPVAKEPMIDALPAFPTGPLSLETLPNERTTSDPPSTSHHPSRETTRPPAKQSHQPHETPVVETTRGTAPGTTTGGGSSTGTSAHTTTPAPAPPPRQTVGPQALTPTNPQKMGDLTEAYFREVTENPAAAHAMTTGTMAREGQQGIEQRYDGVRRVEVQEITIDRNKAITTSRVKVVRDDGTATIEERQLTFTWGGDPKIIEDSTTQ